jgi:hypothetical protein
VSDVHLASKFFCDKGQKEKFWQFLDELGNNPRSRELILNGDIIETWSSPIEVNIISIGGDERGGGKRGEERRGEERRGEGRDRRKRGGLIILPNAGSVYIGEDICT